MAGVIGFILGLMCGGVLGVFTIALVIAGRDDHER